MSSEETTRPALAPHPDGDPRFIAMRTVFNFRDLGGLRTRDGRTVRNGLVYRSDQFGNACPEDVDLLVDKVGLKTVVDLRRGSEIANTGGFAPDRGVDVVHLELSHIPWERFRRDVTREPSPVPFLVQRYTAMAECGAEAVRGTLELMCGATPLVFHCMAGKDRTGIVAGVTLALLGVPEADIAADYALTAQGMGRYREWRLSEGADEHDQWGILPEAEAMLGLLENIDTLFGGIEEYAYAIGFHDVERLREKLLD
ncbi:protein-tyrosine phosphatase [Stackebrandtia albiflava]|uniref:Protein-tyrosine phosphatase n=1 Tax=Stackebrandtia albiflava TaxID=406432 RepID=A0A562VB80_9ACTN|nr:tyrosine-protein phosphatase [Stackebrandtia albiflava]TWJ15125.1 protein-tyrosine phosphatase [Stackebrandtia albiflava]